MLNHRILYMHGPCFQDTQIHAYMNTISPNGGPETLEMTLVKET